VRLHRDLHDGLGPLLTGVALAADAAGNLVSTAPDEAAELLRGVRSDTRTAITEVRRVVDDLRPPALDELGLIGALGARAARFNRRADGHALHILFDAEPLPQLSPAVEAAAYRITVEALTNVVRHSHARTVTVRLSVERDLVIEVIDDDPAAVVWTPGVGINAMRQRAADLGGSCEAGPTSSGGAVRVRLPLSVS